MSPSRLKSRSTVVRDTIIHVNTVRVIKHTNGLVDTTVATTNTKGTRSLIIEMEFRSYRAILAMIINRLGYTSPRLALVKLSRWISSCTSPHFAPPFRPIGVYECM